MPMFPVVSIFFTIPQAMLQKLENNEIKGIKGNNSTTRVRSSHSQMFFKKGVLKNFTIFAGNYLCWSLFKKVYYKETPTKVFYCEYCEIFKSTYFEEHLRAAASGGLRLNKRKNFLIEFVYFYSHELLNFKLNHSILIYFQRIGVTVQKMEKYETGKERVSAPILYNIQRVLGNDIFHISKFLSSITIVLYMEL